MFHVEAHELHLARSAAISEGLPCSVLSFGVSPAGPAPASLHVGSLPPTHSRAQSVEDVALPPEAHRREDRAFVCLVRTCAFLLPAGHAGQQACCSLACGPSCVRAAIGCCGAADWRSTGSGEWSRRLCEGQDACLGCLVCCCTAAVMSRNMAAVTGETCEVRWIVWRRKDAPFVVHV